MINALSNEGAFAFSGSHTIADSAGSRFVHGPRGIHAQSDGISWDYTLQDGLGSVRGEFGGGVNDVHSYDPYGGYIGTAPSDAYFGFTGEMTDTNRQVYLRARYYDPDMGVFPSLDPFEGMMDRPMSINGYSWVEGNPVMNVDPSGMDIFNPTINPDGGGGPSLPIHPAYIARFLEGVVIGGSAVSAAYLAHELNDWVRRNFFDIGIGINPNGIIIHGERYDPAVIIAAMNHLGRNVTHEQFLRFVADGISYGPIVFDADYNPAVPDLFETDYSRVAPFPIVRSETQTQDRNDWEFAVNLGRELCRFALWELLRRLVPGIRDIPLDRTVPDDDDCLDGLTPLETAHRYAYEAQQSWLAGTAAIGRNAPLTIAITKVKIGSECKQHIAISNALGNPTAERVERYKDAWSGVVANARSAIIIGTQEPNIIQGVEGHAERMLYGALGDSIIAMGISQHPCGSRNDPESCSAWLMTKPNISVAYWDGIGTKTYLNS